MNPVLEIRDLRKAYQGPKGTVQAVAGISLAVEAGEFVVVQGASGCGKTTLLLAAGGLLQPDTGQVRLNGQDLYTLSPGQRAQVRAANLGFVFQQFHLVPYLSVWDNVLAPALAGHVPDTLQRAQELIGRFGLQDRAEHVPAELSTGERQRTALARALLNHPRLLLADEPTGNLDQENGQVVLTCLSEFASQGGAVLLVTHDPALAQHARRVLRLKEGRLAGG